MPERHRLQSPSGGWFSRQRVLSESLGILVFIGLAGLGWHRIHLGVDLTDEGFYLSTPYRYTLGDLPFRDETMNPYRMFDILLAPVFRLWPGMTVLQARVLGLALDLGSLFAVYLLLKRRAPPILVALACVSGAFGCGNIWTPGYNLLGRDLLLLGVCAWLGSCLQTRPWAGRTLAFVGGVLACLSCIAYGPNVLIASVPLALLAWLALRGRLRSPTAARTLVFAASWGALGLGCLATGLASGLYADWRYACAFQATLPAYSASLPARLRSFWSEVRPLVPPFLAALGGTGCVLALVSRARSQRRWFWLAAACGVSGGSAYACTVYPSRFAPYALGDHVPFCVMMAALAFLAAAVLLPATAPDELRTDAADGIFVRRALLTVVLLFAIIEGLGSANGLRNALYGAGFLLAVAVAILSCRADGAERAGALSLHQRVALQCCLGLACAAYGALSIRSNFGHVCRDASTPQLTARFTHPLLAGIRSTPERVAAIEGLLEYLSSRVQPGDFLFAYDNVPMLHYLTRTRPATNSVWVTKNWFSAESRCRSVEFMLREQRVPRYAVRCLIHPEGIGSPDGGRMQPYLIDERLDPVHTFVRTHFCRIGTVFPFEVWERSDIAAAASDPRPSLRLREEFNGWTGPERVNNIDTAGTLLQCGGERGQYAFERKMEAGGAYLETRLVKQTVGDAPVLQLQHSLSAGLHGGQLATLVAVVRLSLGARCQLFIQDRTAAGWQRTTALLGPSTTWTTASVEAAVRDGVVQASAGFYFEPASEGQSLEIKSMELLVEP